MQEQDKNNSLHISDYAVIGFALLNFLSMLNIFLSMFGVSDIRISLVLAALSFLFLLLMLFTFDPSKSQLVKIQVDTKYSKGDLMLYKNDRFEEYLYRQEMLNYLREIQRQTNPYTRFGKWGGNNE